MIRRTSLINQIRAFLLERGMVFAKSPIRPREAIPEVIENANEDLTPRMRNLVAMLWSEWKDLELQIGEMNDEVERIASSDAACIRLRQIPGVGPLVATAIVASIGNGAAFRKGREFAAWMGRVPKQHPTGGKAKLYGISKRGNSTICARSWCMGLGQWCCDRNETAHRDTRHMDNGTGDESTTQRVDRCYGEQAGADRMGGPFNRSGLPGCSECDGST